MEIVPRLLIYGKTLFSIVGITYCNIKINIIFPGIPGECSGLWAPAPSWDCRKADTCLRRRMRGRCGSPGQTSGAPAGAAAPGEDQEDDRRKSVRGGESDAAHAKRSQVRRRGLVAKPCVPDALSFQSWTVPAIGKTTYGSPAGRDERMKRSTVRCRCPSGKAILAIGFGRQSIERSFDKLYRIDGGLEFSAKLLDGFFHRGRQVSPIVNHATHRFFDREQHFCYCNFTEGSRHRPGLPAAPPDCPANLSARSGQARERMARRVRRASIAICFQFERDRLAPRSHFSGTSAGAPFFLISNTRNFVGLSLLAFRSTTWTSSGPS
jgi:hypothetical protein